MKRIIPLIAALLAALLLLASCSGGGEGTETSDRTRQKYMENRKSFTESEVYKTALAYVEESIKSEIPDAEYEISLEPGTLEAEELDKYADLSENEETRLDFFSKADLSFRVDYSANGVSPEDLGRALAARGITGRLMSEESGGSYYGINAADGSVKFTPIPAA